MSYVKVYKYKKQISLDNGVTWQDVTPEEYVPSGDPIGYYDTYEECIAQYRTVSTGRTCSGTHGVDLYQLVEYQASYDDGITWTTISSTTGSLIEANSSACGYRTRTTSGTAYCTGYDKYQDVYSQVSYDNGNTWTTTATTPTLIEADSPDCGYVPPTPASPKYVLTLNDSSTVSAECDSTSSVTSGEVSSQYSGSVVSAEIGDCVTVIDGYAFARCYNLTSVTIPDSVTNIDFRAFYRCSGLTSIDIPSGVTEIGTGSFQQCRSLTSVTIPSGVTEINASIFKNCVSLTSITCLAITPPEIMGSGPFDDTNDCPIYVPCASVDAYKTASGWSSYASRIQGIPPCGQPTFDGKYKLTLSDSSIASAACDSSSAVTSGEVSTQYSGTVVSAVIGDCVTSIDKQAFYFCGELTAVTLGTSVTSIGFKAFRNCTGLTSVTIPDSVTTIDYDAFVNCYGLININIPSGVTSISHMTFGGCNSLASIDIPSGVTSIGENAFIFCSSLTSIKVNATTPPALGNQAFYGSTCNIYVPASAVNTYKNASGWSDYASRIQAIP